MPDEGAYLFDIVPNNKPGKGFRVTETRTQNPIVKSDHFKATIKLGTVAWDCCSKEHALEHVVAEFKNHPLDTGKVNGMSRMWVVDVLETLERRGLLHPKKDAKDKVEEQTRALEKQMAASRGAGRR